VARHIGRSTRRSQHHMSRTRHSSIRRDHHRRVARPPLLPPVSAYALELAPRGRSGRERDVAARPREESVASRLTRRRARRSAGQSEPDTAVSRSEIRAAATVERHGAAWSNVDCLHDDSFNE
jgi:hypothetical protein